MTNSHDTHTTRLNKSLQEAFVKQENDYIERALQMCTDFCPIKTYSVIRANTFNELKEEVDKFIEENPDYELGDGILKKDLIGYEKYTAILVNYDFEEKERRRLEADNIK